MTEPIPDPIDLALEQFQRKFFPPPIPPEDRVVVPHHIYEEFFSMGSKRPSRRLKYRTGQVISRDDAVAAGLTDALTAPLEPIDPPEDERREDDDKQAIPKGSAEALLAWVGVGGDESAMEARARRLLDRERASSEPRLNLVNRLKDILDLDVDLP